MDGEKVGGCAGCAARDGRGFLIEGRRAGRLSRRGARRARCVRLSGA